MNHERFERLILADRPLTPAEIDDVRSHAAGCRPCAELQSGWMRAEAVLSTASAVAPQPGFVARWARRRAAESKRGEGREAWRLFGGTTLAAAMLTALLGLITWQSLGSIPALMAGVLEQGLRMWLWARVVGELTRALASALPVPVTAGAFLGFTVLVAGLGLTSALVSVGIVRFSFQGVRT